MKPTNAIKKRKNALYEYSLQALFINNISSTRQVKKENKFI